MAAAAAAAADNDYYVLVLATTATQAEIDGLERWRERALDADVPHGVLILGVDEGKPLFFNPVPPGLPPFLNGIHPDYANTPVGPLLSAGDHRPLNLFAPENEKAEVMDYFRGRARAVACTRIRFIGCPSAKALQNDPVLRLAMAHLRCLLQHSCGGGGSGSTNACTCHTDSKKPPK